MSIPFLDMLHKKVWSRDASTGALLTIKDIVKTLKARPDQLDELANTDKKNASEVSFILLEYAKAYPDLAKHILANDKLVMKLLNADNYDELRTGLEVFNIIKNNGSNKGNAEIEALCKQRTEEISAELPSSEQKPTNT